MKKHQKKKKNTNLIKQRKKPPSLVFKCQLKAQNFLMQFFFWSLPRPQLVHPWHRAKNAELVFYKNSVYRIFCILATLIFSQPFLVENDLWEFHRFIAICFIRST